LTTRGALPLAGETLSPASGISPRWLLAAPHRLFFFLGMLGLAAASVWWLVQIAARTAGHPMALALPPAWMHGWLMANGFLPFYMFGFLFTAVPKWLHAAPLSTRALLVPGVTALVALAVALVGAQVSGTLLAAGAVLLAIAWGALLTRFARLIRASRVDDRVHARLVLAAFCVGAAAHLVFAAGVVRLDQGWIHAAEMLTIWFFLAPVFVTVAHRLIPFFTANVVPLLDAWRPLWLLWTFLMIVVGHGVLPVIDLLTGSALIGLMRAIFDLVGAALLLYVAWRWGVVQSLRNRLLAMLHLGFVWLGMAFALYAWNAGVAMLDASSASIGLAPLHALTMGFFGSTMLAMVTRVTAGHSGRSLVADAITWWLFWILQTAVLARLLVDAFPPQAVWLTFAAIVLWCAAMLPWAARSIPVYLRSRPDRRPG
jgi:uncharacterized protein involved in response to NO